MVVLALAPGYLLVALGSIGMIVFALRLSLTTSVRQQRQTGETLLGMGGYTVWTVSWVCIIIGTILQGTGSLLPPLVAGAGMPTALAGGCGGVLLAAIVAVVVESRSR